MTDFLEKSDEQVSTRVLMIVVAAVQFIVPFLNSAVFVALPDIGHELDASAFELSLIQTALVLGIASFLVPAGRFADIHGRKRVFIFGTLFACVTSLASALVGSIGVFILLRFLLGVACAMIFSTSIAILTSVFPAGKRGRVMGVVVACVYMGMAFGPSISGFIIDYMGWRWIFFLTSGTEALVLFLMFLRFKGEWANSPGEPFDWGGAAVFIISMVLIICGATELDRMDEAKWLCLAGLLGMGLFFRLQWRSPYPILDVHLLVDNLGFTFSNTVTFINYASYSSFLFLFCLYLQFAKGFSPKYAGLLLLVQPLVQAVLSPIAGRLADSYQPAYIATIGMGFCTVGLFLAGSMDAGTSLIMIIVIAGLMGVSLGLFATPNMTSIMDCVQPRHVANAASMVGTMRSTGMLASATIIAITFSYYLGNEQVTNENIGAFIKSMHISLYLFSAMSLVGTFFSMVKGRLATSISTIQHR